MKVGDKVKLPDHEATGQIVGINGDLFFICVPDNRSNVALMYTRAELSPDTDLTPAPNENKIEVSEEEDY